MERFSETIVTNGYKLYAVGDRNWSNSYIEIGYYDMDGNMIPLASVEAQEEGLTGKKINSIMRHIYNPNDIDDQKIDTIIEQ